MKNNWEIIDDNGVIYSGTEEEMVLVFSNIVNGDIDQDDLVEWIGDLKLVEVHNIYR